MNPLDHERFAMMMKLIVWKPMASWTKTKRPAWDAGFMWGSFTKKNGQILQLPKTQEIHSGKSNIAGWKMGAPD